MLHGVHARDVQTSFVRVEIKTRCFEEELNNVFYVTDCFQAEVTNSDGAVKSVQCSVVYRLYTQCISYMSVWAANKPTAERAKESPSKHDGHTKCWKKKRIRLLCMLFTVLQIKVSSFLCTVRYRMRNVWVPKYSWLQKCLLCPYSAQRAMVPQMVRHLEWFGKNTAEEPDRNAFLFIYY